MEYESKDLCFTKSIEGFPGYLICKDGRVISLQRKQKRNKISSRILKPGKSPLGYLTVSLSIKGKGMKQKKVSRLVAEAFVPNPENKPEVNHKNGIRNDNRLENLEWATHRENRLHSYRELNRESAVSKIDKATAKKIAIEYDKGIEAKELSSKYNLSITQIIRIGKRENWGHLWK